MADQAVPKPIPAWTTPEMAASLAKLGQEAKELAEGRVIKTEGEQALAVAHRRLIETLLTGAPVTPIAARHHE